LNQISRMSLKTVLVTGSNRGIGLEMIRQLVAGRSALGQPRHVFACCRNQAKATELKSIAAESKSGTTVHIVPMEVTDDRKISDAVKFVDSVVGDDGLNLLINNAATLERDGSQLPTVERANLTRHFDVNVNSPILISQAFLPLLRRSSNKVDGEKLSVFRASVVNISSGAGSIGLSRADNLKLGVGYRLSKAALNMVTKCLAVDLKSENILFISISPGWVQTDMGGPKATLTPHESVSKLLDTLARLNEEHSGGFFRNDGSSIAF